MPRSKNRQYILECEHIPRAKWVDCVNNPKHKGVFEGRLKGEPDSIRKYKWTGRRWLYQLCGLWVPSIFGMPGDKFRGLAQDPNEASIQSPGVAVEAPQAAPPPAEDSQTNGTQAAPPTVETGVRPYLH